MQRRDTEKMAVREKTALKGRKKRRGKPTADVKAEKEVESEKNNEEEATEAASELRKFRKDQKKVGESLTTAAFQIKLETANQASTASGAVATPEQKVDGTKHMPPPSDGENNTSDEDCIEVMSNQNGQCPECGGRGARYTLCQDCEDSGMIYEISPDRNSDRNNESESGDPIGHCQ